MRAFRFALAVSLAVILVFAAANSADARGRSRTSSPFVNTPMGLIPKSVYYSQMMQFVDPAMIQRFRQAEQAYYDKMNKGKSGQGGNTTKTPPTTPKKKV